MALCTGLLVLFRERINHGGRISKVLAENSFGIYFLHAPVVVAVTLAFGWLTLPPIAKAVVMDPHHLAAVVFTSNSSVSAISCRKARSFVGSCR
jgi:peptidoglycan/LPS O-acetylase OafA/YrhL